MLKIGGRYNVISSGNILFWSAIYKTNHKNNGVEYLEFRTQDKKTIYVSENRNLFLNEINDPEINPKTNRPLKVKIENL